jgi:hypothetical protein
LKSDFGWWPKDINPSKKNIFFNPQICYLNKKKTTEYFVIFVCHTVQ